MLGYPLVKHVRRADGLVHLVTGMSDKNRVVACGPNAWFRKTDGMDADDEPLTCIRCAGWKRRR